MKTLLTTCLFAALMAATAGTAPAAAREYLVSQSDVCLASCRANAEYCRTLCSDPEEQAQCIVGCDKGECKANCDKFEASCKQRCQNTGG